LIPIAALTAMMAVPAGIGVAKPTVQLGDAQAATQMPKAAPQTPKSITRADFIRGITARFNAIVTDRDGYLEWNEIAAAQQKGS